MNIALLDNIFLNSLFLDNQISASLPGRGWYSVSNNYSSLFVCVGTSFLKLKGAEHCLQYCASALESRVQEVTVLLCFSSHSCASRQSGQTTCQNFCRCFRIANKSMLYSIFLDYLYLHIVLISTVTHCFDCLKKRLDMHHRHLSNSIYFKLLLKSAGGNVSQHYI